MKSAEQWANERDWLTPEKKQLMFEWIKAIQLDALKAGMTRAAELCGERGENQSGSYRIEAESCVKAISMLRDSITELPKP